NECGLWKGSVDSEEKGLPRTCVGAHSEAVWKAELCASGDLKGQVEDDRNIGNAGRNRDDFRRTVIVQGIAEELSGVTHADCGRGPGLQAELQICGTRDCP